MTFKDWKKSTYEDYIALWKHKDGKRDIFLYKRGNPEQGYVYDVILEKRKNGSTIQKEISHSNKNKESAIKKAREYMKI